MDDREILTRFKTGTLDRAQAARLLSRGAPTALPQQPEGLRTPDAFPAPGTLRTPDAFLVPDTAPVPDALRAPGGTAAPAPEDAAYPARTARPVGDRFAVIGLAGRYPQAPDLDAHWENLRSGRDTSSPAPSRRPGPPVLDARARGHFLDDVDGFDTEFFAVAPADAALIDPQERLFLEVAWEALEDAGYAGCRLDALTGPHGQPRALGVFVGASTFDYALLGAEAWARGRCPSPSTGHYGLTGRLVTLLGLTGPAQAVDTAESSALTALHLAAGALRRGECAAALVGGVELLLHPSRGRDLAGEGVGALVVKPLEAALADGDQVHAVVRATATGFPGALPDPAGAPPAVLHETRGTTTARIGDAGAATGLAALTAAVLQLRHGLLLPPHGSGEAAAPWPRPRDDRGQEVARAAVVEVSAPGCPTSRAVVEEHLPARPEPASGPAPWTAGRGEPVVLSAATPAHLRADAARIAERLSEGEGEGEGEGKGKGEGATEPTLAAVARALRVGRAALPCRLAFVADDVPGLARALRDFAETGTPPAGAHHADLRGGDADPLGLGAVPETRDYLAALWRGGRLDQLLRLWLSGLDVDWAALEDGPRAPGTPWSPPRSVFLRRPYWLDVPTASAAPAGGRTERPT
ncbi:beta-ketoacyl [acyl carrier protein] synthase domain-containing protein [Streptomyces sp. NPDC002644]